MINLLNPSFPTYKLFSESGGGEVGGIRFGGGGEEGDRCVEGRTGGTEETSVEKHNWSGN